MSGQISISLDAVGTIYKNFDEALSIIVKARNTIGDSPLRDCKARRIQMQLDELNATLDDEVYRIGLAKNKLEGIRVALNNYSDE